MKEIDPLLQDLRDLLFETDGSDLDASIVSNQDLSDTIDWLFYYQGRARTLVRRRKKQMAETDALRLENMALKEALAAVTEKSDYPLWRRIAMQRVALRTTERTNIRLMAWIDRIQHPAPLPPREAPKPEDHKLVFVIHCEDDKVARYYCSCGFVGKASVPYAHMPTHALGTRLHRNHGAHARNAWVKQDN